MEAFASPALWGSPLGIAIVLVSVGVFFIGLGVLVWSVGRAKTSQAEVALKEMQFDHQRKRDA